MLECPLESFSIFTLFDMDRYEEFRRREGEEENSGPERSRMWYCVNQCWYYQIFKKIWFFFKQELKEPWLSLSMRIEGIFLFPIIISSHGAVRPDCVFFNVERSVCWSDLRSLRNFTATSEPSGVLLSRLKIKCEKLRSLDLILSRSH